VTTASTLERRHHAEQYEGSGSVFPAGDCDVCSKVVTKLTFHAGCVSWLPLLVTAVAERPVETCHSYRNVKECDGFRTVVFLIISMIPLTRLVVPENPWDVSFDWAQVSSSPRYLIAPKILVACEFGETGSEGCIHG
jgi:hypothetical protein